MTREQSIIEHRKMWNWISDETLRAKHIIYKDDYFLCNDINRDEIYCKCYLCDYATSISGWKDKCQYCPIDWGSTVENVMCLDKEYYDDEKGLYELWVSATERFDYKKAADLARQIAELPERIF